ncbi:MAG: hypothetical protein AAB341_01240 [Planctomycetota bacterium]
MRVDVTMLLAEGSVFDSIKDAINAICQPAPFLIVAVAALGIFLVGYRTFTRPVVAIPLAVAFTVFFIASCFDPNFVEIVKKADNVPIVMMIVAVGFFLWLSFRQAAINDERIEKGQPLIEAGADDKVLVWPDLVYIELIALVLFTAFLTVWAIVLRAPLEQPADPNIAPNPAKAPWYFLGLQEMLVYFDPWLAGVVLPGLIIVGLIAIPYMDKNPRGNGYYTFKERRFAITTFLFGFVILWVVLIIFGTFLRGPNWNFFGPYQYWDLHKPMALLNTEFHDLIWIGLFGRALPTEDWLFVPSYIIRELPGIVLVAGYFIIGPLLLRALFFRKLYQQMGLIRYSVMSMLMLVMLLMPIKMVLRWTLNLHYIVGITEWFLNV